MLILLLRLHLLRFVSICITRARFVLDFADSRKKVCVCVWLRCVLLYIVCIIVLLLFYYCYLCTAGNNNNNEKKTTTACRVTHRKALYTNNSQIEREARHRHDRHDEAMHSDWLHKWRAAVAIALASFKTDFGTERESSTRRSLCDLPTAAVAAVERDQVTAHVKAHSLTLCRSLALTYSQRFDCSCYCRRLSASLSLSASAAHHWYVKLGPKLRASR